MFEHLKKNGGFVLLESLLALSLISFTVILLIPMLVQLTYQREVRKNRVEDYRALYDYSVKWQGDSFSYQIDDDSELILKGVTSEKLY